MPNASLTRKSAGELVALVKSREITPVEILDEPATPVSAAIPGQRPAAPLAAKAPIAPRAAAFAASRARNGQRCAPTRR